MALALALADTHWHSWSLSYTHFPGLAIAIHKLVLAEAASRKLALVLVTRSQARRNLILHSLSRAQAPVIVLLLSCWPCLNSYISIMAFSLLPVGV